MEICWDDAHPDNKQVAAVLILLANTLDTLGIPLVPAALELLAESVEDLDDRRLKDIIEALGLEGGPSA